jgi:hypothetical protein
MLLKDFFLKKLGQFSLRKKNGPKSKESSSAKNLRSGVPRFPEKK